MVSFSWFVAAGLSLLANLAYGATPDYCIPLESGTGQFGAGFYYIDLSQDCINAGIGDQCCMIFPKSNYPNSVWTEDDRNDLLYVISEQSTKTGRFKDTSKGRWRAHWNLVVFAANDLIPSELLQVWFHTIQGFKLEETDAIHDIVLNFAGNGISNYMTIKNYD